MIIQFAKLNSLAYTIESQIQADEVESNNEEFLHVRYYIDEPTDAEFVVFEYPNRNKVFCFRGTDTFKDFSYDIDFVPVIWDLDLEKNYHIHRGFYAQFKAIQEKVKAELNPRTGNGAKNFFTGHSLGGALGTIAGITFDHLGYDIHKIVTFGSPRCISEEFAEWYNEKLGNVTFRVHDALDTICHLPIKGPLLKYKHVKGYNILLKNRTIISKQTKCRGIIDFFQGLWEKCEEHKMSQYLHDVELYPFLDLL